MLSRGFIVLGAFLLAPLARAAARPVEFDFVPPPNPSVSSPFARELWAEVVTPSGRTLDLPAYCAGADVFAVRARPDERGDYRFGRVTEGTAAGGRASLGVRLVSPADIENRDDAVLPAIALDPENPHLFKRSDGRAYIPIGANLAWAPDSTLEYHLRAIPEFARAGLNWMRVWMAHWNGMNLDWLPASLGPSPQPGYLDERVALKWDRLLEAAEDNGVYIQVVLQHHGQYTTHNDSDWGINPWNDANPGGFLKSPPDFFTDARARAITRAKYRTIVARWGWCPAVVAWELFNEVHWTNAMIDGREADVARWHDEMADFIRSVDVYRHLVTTSTEKLRSPIYRKMDYYQPHLYAADPIAAARSFKPPVDSLDRPAFYGEMGDDKMHLPEPARKAGLTLLPIVWASIMGEGPIPAQPWDGWQLFEQHRLDQLGAVNRFLTASGLAAQRDLRAFSAQFETADGKSSVLSLIGRRNSRFMAAWIWNQPNLYSLAPSAPVAGVAELEDIPAGTWKVTWWDTSTGLPSSSMVIEHSGGLLKLPTPPISRHAAVILSLPPWLPTPGPQERDPLARISVRGNHFVDPSGGIVLFRGLSVADPDTLARQGRWNKELFAAVKDMGANLVRLPVHPGAWRSRTPSGYLALLDEAVGWCGDLGIHVIIDWHSIGNLKAGMFQEPVYETTVAETLDFWRRIAMHFRGRPTVAFYELFNEPTHFNGMLGPLSWADWRDLNEQMIGVIRYWDKDTVPLVAGFDWAYDLDAIRYDPVRAEGIGYVTHPYADKRTRPWEPKWDEDFAFAADKYPVIATEIGFSLQPGEEVDDDHYGNRITRFLEQRGISWVAWVFDPDWKPQMLRSFDGFVPTGSGAFFKQAMHRPAAPPQN